MENIITNKEVIKQIKESKLKTFFLGVKKEWKKITWLDNLSIWKQFKVVLISGTILTLLISLVDTMTKYIVNLFM